MLLSIFRNQGTFYRIFDGQFSLIEQHVWSISAIELYLWIIAYPVYKDVMEHIQKCPSQSKAEPKPDLEPQCQV